MKQKTIDSIHALFARIAADSDLSIGLAVAIGEAHNLSYPEVFKLWEDWQTQDETNEATETLAVAAPDLLEALELLLAHHTLPASLRFVPESEVYDTARAAIAKARAIA
jgi:hypothetical protein